MPARTRSAGTEDEEEERSTRRPKFTAAQRKEAEERLRRAEADDGFPPTTQRNAQGNGKRTTTKKKGGKNTKKAKTKPKDNSGKKKKKKKDADGGDSEDSESADGGNAESDEEDNEGSRKGAPGGGETNESLPEWTSRNERRLMVESLSALLPDSDSTVAKAEARRAAMRTVREHGFEGVDAPTLAAAIEGLAQGSGSVGPKLHKQMFLSISEDIEGADESAIATLARGKVSVNSVGATMRKAIGAGASSEIDETAMQDVLLVIEGIELVAPVGCWAGARELWSAASGIARRIRDTKIRREVIPAITEAVLEAMARRCIKHCIEVSAAADFGSEVMAVEIPGRMDSVLERQIHFIVMSAEIKGGGRKAPSAGAGTPAVGAAPGAQLYCQHFLRGACTRTNCSLPHLRKDEIVCRWFTAGHCKKGGACDYKH